MAPSSELPVSCSASGSCFGVVFDSHWIKFSLLVQVRVCSYTRNFAAKCWEHLSSALNEAFSPPLPASNSGNVVPHRGCWILTLTLSLPFFVFIVLTQCGHLNHVYGKNLPEHLRGLIFKFSFGQTVPSVYGFISCDVIHWYPV